MTSILTSTNRSRFSCTYSVFQQWWRKWVWKSLKLNAIVNDTVWQRP